MNDTSRSERAPYGEIFGGLIKRHPLMFNAVLVVSIIALTATAAMLVSDILSSSSDDPSEVSFGIPSFYAPAGSDMGSDGRKETASENSGRDVKVAAAEIPKTASEGSDASGLAGSAITSPGKTDSPKSIGEPSTGKISVPTLKASGTAAAKATSKPVSDGSSSSSMKKKHKSSKSSSKGTAIAAPAAIAAMNASAADIAPQSNFNLSNNQSINQSNLISDLNETDMPEDLPDSVNIDAASNASANMTSNVSIDNSFLITSDVYLDNLSIISSDISPMSSDSSSAASDNSFIASDNLSVSSENFTTILDVNDLGMSELGIVPEEDSSQAFNMTELAPADNETSDLEIGESASVGENAMAELPIPSLNSIGDQSLQGEMTSDFNEPAGIPEAIAPSPAIQDDVEKSIDQSDSQAEGQAQQEDQISEKRRKSPTVSSNRDRRAAALDRRVAASNRSSSKSPSKSQDEDDNKISNRSRSANSPKKSTATARTPRTNPARSTRDRSRN